MDPKIKKDMDDAIARCKVEPPKEIPLKPHKGVKGTERYQKQKALLDANNKALD